MSVRRDSNPHLLLGRQGNNLYPTEANSKMGIIVGHLPTGNWEVDGIEPLAPEGLRLQRNGGTSLPLLVLPMKW